jgi:Ca2+-binding EF-hand superfamily protein
MTMKTVLIAALAGVFAVTAAAPSFAAKDPAKKEKRIHRLIKHADLNGDGKVSESEMTRGIAVTFAKIDTNGDGVLSASEISGAKAVLKAERKRAKAAGEGRLQFVKFPAKRINKRFDQIDANGDGRLSKAEFERVAERMFKKRDKNRDGYISMADFGY